MQKQNRWLFDCIKRNCDTEYGRLYGFKDIHTIKDYQKKVPLVEYEDIASYITRIAKGEDDILFKGKPIAFESTGGSSGGKKLIPYTSEGLRDFRQAISPWFTQISNHYKIDLKLSYWSISPALHNKKRTPRGLKIGVDDTIYLGDEIGNMISNEIIPKWVAKLNDLHHWRLATLYWLICFDKLELISIWSPTFLLVLIKEMQKEQEILRDLLKHGGKIGKYTVEQNIEALRRFDEYIKYKDTLSLWPNLKLISCWSDAMSKPFAMQLKRVFSHVKLQPKGLISTESVVTMPDIDDSMLLCSQSGFYEFLDSNGDLHLADSLVVDKRYEVIVTTNSGLYRYRSNDMVHYKGRKNNLPILQFVGRKGIVSDMVGEKLNELFVQKVLEDIKGVSMIVAQPQSPTRYLLIGEDSSIESYVDSIEAKLAKNPQYAYARKMGQLEKLKAIVVKNVMKKYIEYKVATKCRVGDIKIPLLHIDNSWIYKK